MSDRIEKNKKMTEKKLQIFKDKGNKDPGDYTFYKSLNMLKDALIENISEDTYNSFTHYSDVLDIGCRGGYFFDVMKEYGYNKFYGVDISEKSIEVLHKKNYEGEVLDIQIEKLDKKFDLIILRHTLEHTEKPKQVIDNCYDMLDVGGILYVEVPKRSKPNDKDESHFSWFKNIVELNNMFDTNWSLIYHQNDYPIIGIYIRE